MQADSSRLEHGISRNTRSCEVVCWINLVGGKRHLSETLKDIGKSQDITRQVDFVIVLEFLAVESHPNVFCVLVVLDANAFFTQLAL